MRIPLACHVPQVVGVWLGVSNLRSAIIGTYNACTTTRCALKVGHLVLSRVTSVPSVTFPVGLCYITNFKAKYDSVTNVVCISC